MNSISSTLKNISRRLSLSFQYTFRPVKTTKVTKGLFGVMVKKEVQDHIRSWRVVILIAIIILTCVASLYAAFSNISKTANDNDSVFFFLKLFTLSDDILPPYFVFIGFLGPLLGIGLGFDAINSEQNRGTLSRILAQPIPRDYIINAKFVASILVISALFFFLSFMVIGVGLVGLGIPPTVEEIVRVIIFTLISILYVAFWLSLSMLFSVRISQPSTSAIASIAVWLFFTVFYPIILNMISKAAAPSQLASPSTIYRYEQLRFFLTQLMPNELFSQVTTLILMPEVRSLGPLTVMQIQGTIPSQLSLGQSLISAMPQVIGLLALTVICFILSYTSFMRREIRSK